MGGVAKGLLRAPDSKTTLLERLCGEVRAALPSAEIVLVGAAEAYAALGLRAIADEPANVGPIGGLAGFLAYAAQSGAGWGLALACDLPRLERGLIARLASEETQVAALVVQQENVKNPLVARYEVPSALAATRRALSGGQRALQAVLDELQPRVLALELSASELLSVRDWDTPDDVARDRH